MYIYVVCTSGCRSGVVARVVEDWGGGEKEREIGNDDQVEWCRESCRGDGRLRVAGKRSALKST